MYCGGGKVVGSTQSLELSLARHNPIQWGRGLDPSGRRRPTKKLGHRAAFPLLPGFQRGGIHVAQHKFAAALAIQSAGQRQGLVQGRLYFV